jgi:hypothetical protein
MTRGATAHISKLPWAAFFIAAIQEDRGGQEGGFNSQRNSV